MNDEDDHIATSQKPLRPSRVKTEQDQRSLNTPNGPRIPTILVVDDDPSMLELVCYFLEKQGYLVLRASTPSRAIDITHEYDGTIDLLITDVMMPEMNGKELADNICTIRNGTKVLFMSGYTNDIIYNDILLNTNLQFIEKPFSSKIFHEKIEKIIFQ